MFICKYREIYDMELDGLAEYLDSNKVEKDAKRIQKFMWVNRKM